MLGPSDCEREGDRTKALRAGDKDSIEDFGQMSAVRQPLWIDGTCATVAIRGGDNCAALSTTYHLAPAEIETLNKQTWGWMGCLRL